MNLFYEDYPKILEVRGGFRPIITDFREYIRLLDMLKCKELSPGQKRCLLQEYFLDGDPVDEEAVAALTAFVLMEEDARQEADSDADETEETGGVRKHLFSYEIDYPYILAGFLRDYQIDLEAVPYLHWWKFRKLFEGLSEDTEIKRRIMYRGIELSDIKNKEERKRISKIQKAIRLPAEELTDYDIGNAFG